WQDSLILILKTTSQILTAGIAITAFSLFLYALTFNLRDRVARSFALIMLCVVVIFTSEAISSITAEASMVEFWARVEWVGIVLLPPAYLQFSDAVLATTGKVSRWRRRW
ncbi:MAG: histidine kinase N-terminal 7TM domain-containing protein, partial [Anaerolineaceae bacterium]